MLRLLLSILLGFTLLEGSSWLLLRYELGKINSSLREAYLAAIGPEHSYPPGDRAYFKRHHFLPYVLNPSSQYRGAVQFNGEYYIRRKEPIHESRPALRILALGGSTTFGEGIAREEDTWVYQLETRVRALGNPQAEVINGGVGGYTVAENTIHYVTMLSRLAPDLVILYTGINDILPRLTGTITSDYGNWRIPWVDQEIAPPFGRAWYSYSRAYHYYYFRRYIAPYSLRGIDSLTSRGWGKVENWEAALKHNSAHEYSEYLRLLVDLLTKQGHRVVLLPQVFNPRDETDRKFLKGVVEHNRINQDIAEERGLVFGSTLSDPALFNVDDFQDNCHFNERGSNKMSDAVYNLLLVANVLTQSAR